MPLTYHTKKPTLYDFLRYFLAFALYGIFAMAAVAVIILWSGIDKNEVIKFYPLLLLAIVFQTINFVMINRKTTLTISEPRLTADMIIRDLNELGYTDIEKKDTHYWILTQKGRISKIFGKNKIEVKFGNDAIELITINYVVKIIKQKLLEKYEFIF